jgi:hypothetical protein
MHQVETMDEMLKRLGGSDAGGQAKAVVKAIALIDAAPGWLDESNRAIALYHFAVALSGRDYAFPTLENAAYLAGNGE